MEPDDEQSAAVEPQESDATPEAPEAHGEIEKIETDPVGRQLPWQRLESLVEQRFEALERRLAARFGSDDAKDARIDRLHAELQEHKRDLLARAVRPVFVRIIRLHGDVGRALVGLRARSAEELTAERLLGVLEGFGDDLEILLADHGVCAFEHPDDTFAPDRQTALEVVDTDEEHRAGEIAHRIRPGFELGSVVLQKERVAVFRAAQVNSTRSETA